MIPYLLPSLPVPLSPASSSIPTAPMVCLQIINFCVLLLWFHGCTVSLCQLLHLRVVDVLFHAYAVLLSSLPSGLSSILCMPGPLILSYITVLSSYYYSCMLFYIYYIYQVYYIFRLVYYLSPILHILACRWGPVKPLYGFLIILSDPKKVKENKMPTK